MEHYLKIMQCKESLQKAIKMYGWKKCIQLQKFLARPNFGIV